MAIIIIIIIVIFQPSPVPVTDHNLADYQGYTSQGSISPGEQPERRACCFLFPVSSVSGAKSQNKCKWTKVMKVMIVKILPSWKTKSLLVLRGANHLQSIMFAGFVAFGIHPPSDSPSIYFENTRCAPSGTLCTGHSITNFGGINQYKSMAILRDFLNNALFGLVI